MYEQTNQEAKYIIRSCLRPKPKMSPALLSLYLLNVSTNVSKES